MRLFYQKFPKYTLVVQAADLVGKGLSGLAKVILTVTDSNDNAPAFVQSSVSTALLSCLNTSGRCPRVGRWWSASVRRDKPRPALNGAVAPSVTSLTSVSLCQYETAVDENKADIQILTMTVTDGDEPHSPAWNAKFKIVGGDPGGYFAVKTGTNKQEGILSTAKVPLPAAVTHEGVFCRKTLVF